MNSLYTYEFTRLSDIPALLNSDCCSTKFSHIDLTLNISLKWLIITYWIAFIYDFAYIQVVSKSFTQAVEALRET